MKKQKILLVLLLLLVSGKLAAQNDNFKLGRRVYLFDLTLSMIGFGGAPNIYDAAITDLIDDINSVQDEKTQLILQPFRTDVMETYQDLATKEGKAKLIKEIEAWKKKYMVKGAVTNTDILTSMKSSMNMMHNDRSNVFFIFTDGKQNGKYSSADLASFIDSKWCDYAVANDVHGYYVMLTHAADDARLERTILKVCNFSVCKGTGQQYLLLYPREKELTFNIKYDKKVILHLDRVQDIAIPVGMKLEVTAENNPYYSVNQTVNVDKDGIIEIVPKAQQSYGNLKNSMKPMEFVSLHLKLYVPDGKTDVQLKNEEIILKLINKPEKTATFHVKE